MVFDLKQFPLLVVDDEKDNLDAFRFNFKKTFEILTAQSGAEALAILKDTDVSVIVTDQRMPKMTGLELLREAMSIRPDAVGIILTAFTDVDVLIDSINQGQIYRYITKPWEAKELRGAVTQAMERFYLQRENRRLAEQLRQYTGYLDREIHGAFDFGQIVGDSPALREVLSKVEQVAPTNSTVLLRGETGTGKELVAHAVHINSPRDGKPFVRVNCAALAPGVLESELFGHEKGAFTGAMARRPGRFELADGGTLFLDEVGDLPMEVQIKLLRTLQEREFERVGGTETIRVDVRVISATNRDLEHMIENGMFREDLYYRLNVFPIFLPPLRDRAEDIDALTDHFISKFSRTTAKRIHGCTAEARDKLRNYAWPGNVRELENIIERSMILVKGTELDVCDLDFGKRASSARGYEDVGSAPRMDTETRTLQERLRDEERKEILHAVERATNIASAARKLGINRSTLYYRMRKHGLEHLLPTRVGIGHETAPPGDGGGSS
jgi:DNA-binding NtrC family response regulator